MERQKNDENNAAIKVKIELESDVEDRMLSCSDNKDSETVKLESDICFKEEQPNFSYIEENILEFEEAAVSFIKPERSDPVESHSDEQKEDIEQMKEVKVLLTKFNKFTCVVCDRHLDRSVPLGACKHLNEIVLLCKDCVKPNGKKYMCVKCSYVSRSRFDLIEHFDGVHRKLKKYKCNECNSAFTQSGSLRVHVLSAHRKVKHACKQCKKVFSSRGYLYEHVNFAHRKLNVFTCDLCNKEFSNRNKFKRHIDRVHRKMKEFVCKECKSAFFDIYQLIQHVSSVHRKLKPFKCDKCNRCFASRGQLKRHINSVHLKIRYSCAKCRKAFTEKWKLVKHINVIHRKIRPFVCTICKLAFGWKCNFEKHMTSAKCQIEKY